MNSSGIFYLKSKFFLYRILTYFSFLLLPVFIQKSLSLNPVTHIFMMILYITFMAGQWFLLGKEIDHRLKIYFRVNSSFDRVVYRLILGMSFFVLVFNILSYLPHKWTYNSFWIIWVILGLFYSWPTRGKIIQETVSTNFSEFRYLDSFEKTLLALILLLFFFSIPETPKLLNIDALKLYFDPHDKMSAILWNFIEVNYYPFKRYPHLFKLALNLHFFIVMVGIYLSSFYAFNRYFFSRRLSLLGVFALISSWAFSKILSQDVSHSIQTTYSLIWIWSLIWVSKSETYRSGLLFGLSSFLGVLINVGNIFLIPIQILVALFVFLPDKTHWYKRQLLKYSSFGIGLSILVFILNIGTFEKFDTLSLGVWSDFLTILHRKAFNSLFYIGILMMIFNLIHPKHSIFKGIQFDFIKTRQVIFIFSLLLFTSLFLDSFHLKSFSAMWIIVFVSLVPIEVIFQNISRLRSRRNMIYLVYILICLLDSHFEGRVKIFLRFLDL